MRYKITNYSLIFPQVHIALYFDMLNARKIFSEFSLNFFFQFIYKYLHYNCTGEGLYISRLSLRLFRYYTALLIMLLENLSI